MECFIAENNKLTHQEQKERLVQYNCPA